jgi:nitrite reductase/ring-hydroxylating ferredoxin subunit
LRISKRSYERSDELVVAAVYTREIGASLERVWENVYDWAHLPWVHADAFSSIERLDSGVWGWHARVGLRRGAETEIELVTDTAARRYVTRTLNGVGAPTEIWTHLDPQAVDRTTIRVEFCVQPLPEQKLRALGKNYVLLYTTLWSQDESMMQARELALRETSAASRNLADPDPIALGPQALLRERLPVAIEFAGEWFRIVEVEGELLAHGLRCPHLLGPLDQCDLVDGRIICPWHGYAYDVSTGRSADGRGLRLAQAPRIEIDPVTDEVVVRVGDQSAQG